MVARRPNRLTPRTVTRRIASGPPAIEKALPAGLLGPGVNGRVTDVASLVQAAQQPQSGLAVPMPRDTYPYAFGPGMPLQPAPLDPVRRDTGRAEPRQWEYPVSWNIQVPGVTGRLVPWQLLRDAADRIAVIRDCIRIRKNEVIGLDWDIVISQRAVETAQREKPDAKRVDLERDIRKELGPHIDRCAEFWQQPDPRNGHDFPTWISKALEEHLVLDAMSIYPRATLGGDLYGLEILDGTTIKPLLDHTGGRPLPPFPAYQQVLQGFPRGEYVADMDGGDGYTSDALIYRVKEARTFTPYGFSAVEQSLEDADLWIKRMGWMKAEYTDGTMPSGWIKNMGTAAWTPGQVLEYETELNDWYSGQTKQRHRYRVLPPGFEPVDSRQTDERYKPDYDLHLLKLVTAHFDMTIAELGFTEAKGLGSSGYHEGQENVQDRKATRPTLKWLAGVLTDISRKFLRMPAQLEFRFLGLDDEDQAEADKVNQTRFANGGITLNEWRDERGQPRYAMPEADMPMIVTSRGVVFLEGASELLPPGELVEPREADPNVDPATGDPVDDTDPGAPASPPAGAPGTKPAPPASKPDKPASDADVKKAELLAYRRWARKGANTRAFRFEHITADDPALADIDPATVVFKAGDAGPKVEGRTWPAWEIDQQTAQYWAGELSRVLSGVPVTRLAERWTESRKSADSDSWLSQQSGNAVGNALQQVITGIYGDGYVIGLHSAAYAIAHARDNTVTWTSQWGDWAPGNRVAARLVGGQALDQFLQQAQVTIRSIAANRMHLLGDALADGLDDGDGPEAIARTLRGVLDDPKWAYTVAITETNRAVTAASQYSYRRNGVDASEWIAGPGACPICQRNADAGAVRLGQVFPSGSTGPPGHPQCRCATAPVVSSMGET